MKIDTDQSIGSVTGQQELITINARESVQEAWKTMDAYNIRHLPVILGNEIVGIITPRDMTRALRLESRHQDWPLVHAADFEPRFICGDIMSMPVAIMSSQTTLAEAAKQMATQQLSALLLADSGGRITGIMTVHDVLKTLSQALESETLGIAEKGLFLLSKWPIKQIIDEAASSGI